FRNISLDDATKRITSGLVGRSEPLRRLGVILDATSVKTRAAQLGLGGMNGELTQQDKIVARLSLLTEQLSTAQGDFARTSNNLANTQRILTANMENLHATIGALATPAVAGFTSELSGATRGLQHLTEIVPRGSSAMRAFGGFLGDVVLS